MRVVLLADGKSKPDHLDNHRLLTPINGEPLLQRTINQFRPFGPVFVLTGDKTIRSSVDADGFLPGSDQSHRFYQADMIRKGLEVVTDRTVVVFGDVVFTPEAVNIITGHRLVDWAVYGRSKTVRTDTAPYGEYFAIDLTVETVKHGLRALDAAAGMFRRGAWKRCSAWEWYFQMEGLPYRIRNPKNIQTGPHWVEINDATDDIDLPADLDRFR